MGHERGAADGRRPVLIVEDDPDIGELVLQLLEDEGYPALWARDGKQALDVLASVRPCLILLDLMMPVMNGWQVLEALSQDVFLAPLPVIVTTAAPSAAVGDRHTVLRKPYDLQHVVTLVQAHCDPPPAK